MNISKLLVVCAFLLLVLQGDTYAQDAKYTPSQIGDINSLQTSLDAKTRQSTDVSVGVYQPLFLSAGGFASTSGSFVIASGGGLIATNAGTSVSGIINLPATIDSTKPWRFAALVDYEGDNTNALSVRLQNPNDTAFAEVDLGISSSGVGGSIGGTNTWGVQSGIAAGQKYWLGAASDGNTVTVSILPFGTRYGTTFQPTFQTTVFQDAYRTFAASYANGSHTAVFTNLSQIKISTASTTNKILGVYFNQGLAGAPDPRMQPPALLAFTAGGDSNCMLRLPSSYTGRTANADLVLIGHPNGSNELTGMRVADPDTGTAFAYLVNQGYIEFTLRGDPSSFTNANASDWGSGAGLKIRNAVVAWVRANCPGTRNLYWIGQSMGCLDGLNYAMQYPGSIKAIVGISGVCNLSAAYAGSNSGAVNSSYINIAYPTYYVSLISSNTGNALTNVADWQQVSAPGGSLPAWATGTNQGAYSAGTTYAATDIVTSNATAITQVADRDPTLRSGFYIPNSTPWSPPYIDLWLGDSDTTIPKAQTDVFVSAMAALGVTVPENVVVGANHLSASGLWNGPAIYSFFQAHQ